jgi:putative selenium metabolism hydrolase
MNETNSLLNAKLRQIISTEALIADCQSLVRIPSLSGEEQPAAVFYSDLLRRLGYDRVEIDDKSNVLGWIGGSGRGPTVMLNGHLDHVSPATMTDPYSGLLVDGERWGDSGQAIYGRGTCDMKCALIAAAHAGGAVKRADGQFDGHYVIAADVGEEIDSPDGIQHILASGVTADVGISAEATSLAVYLGHRGKVEFELTVHGRTAHASNPQEGINAIVMMRRLLKSLEQYGQTLPTDPVLGQATMAVTDIWARPGGAVAVVPDECTIRMERRFLPDESPESCRAELEQLVVGLHKQDPDFHCTIDQVNLYPLMLTEANHPFVQSAVEARSEVLGDPGRIGSWRFGVNGTFMAAAGIPTIGLGPGDERWVHSPDEHVPVSHIVAAARIYAHLIMNIGNSVR